jgi:predicted  nucleic acid-binding Zn-ribbon protein
MEQHSQNEVAAQLKTTIEEMQLGIGNLVAYQTKLDEIAKAMQLFMMKWAPDVERVTDEHAEDIEALKNSLEHVGKSIAAIRKDIVELRRENELNSLTRGVGKDIVDLRLRHTAAENELNSLGREWGNEIAELRKEIELLKGKNSNNV